MIALTTRSLPVGWRAAVWLAALLSPTGYVLLLVALCRMQMPVPSAWFVFALFCLIPLMALLVCGGLVWLSRLRLPWKVGWLVLTLLVMLFQVAVWVIIIVSAVTVAISPA